MHGRTGSLSLQRVLIVVVIGLFAGLLCFVVRGVPRLVPGPGDFNWALDTARDLLAGRDPYDFKADALHVPYPLPVAMFGLPWLWLSPRLAATCHFGIASAFLAYAVLRKGHLWQLLIFFSFPYAYSLLYTQWSPLISATWFFPILAPTLALVKPQVALPVVLSCLSLPGVLLSAGIFLCSLGIYPSWPFHWAGQLGPFESIVPFLSPAGFLLIPLVLRLRSSRARMLLLMSLMPIRAAYDLSPLFLIPRSAVGMLLLVALSWIPALWNPSLGFAVRPEWTAVLLFVPAMLLLFARR